jgi:branched-chain amino acid transport system permease protein
VQYTVNGLTTGSFYALVALGYTMVYGVIRLINFAHGDFFMVGAFIGWSVLSGLSGTAWPLPMVLAVGLLVSMTATGGLGVVAARIAYQPLLRAPRLSILISALGLSLALEYGVEGIYGPGFESYPVLLRGQAFSLGGVGVTFSQVAIGAAALVLMAGLHLFVRRTALGTAMRALAMDQDAARLMGIDVERVILLTFLLGTSLAAAAGFMSGVYYGQINFLMGFILGLRAFTAAVLGGIGNIPGAVVGGVLIGLLESYASGYVSGAWKDVAVFGVLIAVLVVRPSGIFGERVVERV